MCQISSLMAATGGPVAEFSSFTNFEERKRKSNLLKSFPKIVHQKGSFGQMRKNPLFRFCRPILDIFGLTLLNVDLRLISTANFDNIMNRFMINNRTDARKTEVNLLNIQKGVRKSYKNRVQQEV